MTQWTIGQTAQAAGVSVDTIRFYEKEGLLPPPTRSSAGYRLYDQASLKRVTFVVRAKRLGFSLQEIMELLDLRVQPGARCVDVRERAQSKMLTIQAKIGELEMMHRALEVLVEQCHGDGPVGACPIVDALEES